jgi:ubiquitin C-terminal hydrolase
MIGLQNLGNSCYLNSAIQAFRHTRTAADYFGGDVWRTHSNPTREGHQFATQFADIIQRLVSPATSDGRVTVVPRGFYAEFTQLAKRVNPDFGSGAPADAAEALQLILDTLHEQLSHQVSMTINCGVADDPTRVSYVKSLESWIASFHSRYSAIIENYYGQTRTSVVCAECGNISCRYEPWSIYKVPIPNDGGTTPVSLTDCFAASTAEEELEDYDCSKCSKRTKATLRTTLSRLPPYMFVNIKRFTVDGRKNQRLISYNPDSVDISPYYCWPESHPTLYRVVATVEHLGNNRGGHYYMRGRLGDKWIAYDDTTVGEVRSGHGTPDTYLVVLERVV